MDNCGSNGMAKHPSAIPFTHPSFHPIAPARSSFGGRWWWQWSSRTKCTKQYKIHIPFSDSFLQAFALGRIIHLRRIFMLAIPSIQFRIHSPFPLSLSPNPRSIQFKYVEFNFNEMNFWEWREMLPLHFTYSIQSILLPFLSIKFICFIPLLIGCQLANSHFPLPIPNKVPRQSAEFEGRKGGGGCRFVEAFWLL